MSTAESDSATPTNSKAVPVNLASRTPNVLVLCANDDNLEREQARAARIASIRFKSAATTSPSSSQSQSKILNHDQIADLLQNCLKLASENKINQKNTWELNLIDHLSEIIQTKPEVEDAETNFQKASCSLEAGVKIYSLRVDSLHSEAYKVLGGINRVGREHEDENVAEGNRAHDGTEHKEGFSRKDLERKLSPLSTLATSFEALNIKKFDVAFTVDPLYHQTSAQFDEGGAKGLLLNNLGIYGNCRVLFDSFEVPEKCIMKDTESDKSELIDLSFAKEYIDQMMINMPKKAEISPTLRDIIDKFGEKNQRLFDEFPVEKHSYDHGEINDIDHPNVNENCCDYCPDAFDHDDHTSVADDNLTSPGRDFTSYQENFGSQPMHDQDIEMKPDEEVVDFLSFSLGFSSRTNAWAGPDYWKFKKSKGLEREDFVEKHEIATKKTKAKKPTFDIDFSKSLEMEFPNIFDPPKNPKSLLLSNNRTPCNIILPEDCHYKPESLANLFILPDVMCFGKKSKKLEEEPERPNGDLVSCASWDKDSVDDNQCDDGNFNSDIDEPGSLVRIPRQVKKINMQYDRVSKQVDVQALKESLWTTILSSVKMVDQSGSSQASSSSSSSTSSSSPSSSIVSLRQVMQHMHKSGAALPTDSSSSSSQKDVISPHLVFICLLHLANEHDLILHLPQDLDDVHILLSS